METITVTFPEIKINMNPDDLNFDTLEDTVFNTSQEAARAVMSQALEDIDSMLKIERPRGDFKNSGKRSKHFLTRMGAVVYQRTRYFEKTTGKSRYLLEERLGLKPDQRVSMKRNQIEMMIVSNFPYRSAQKILKLITGQARSHEATRQSVLAEGRKIQNHEKQSLLRIKTLKDKPDETKEAPEIAYHEADSTFIKLQRSRKRKYPVRNTITTKKTWRKRRQSIEIKLGIGYTGKTKRYPKGARLAQELTNKFLFCDISKGSDFMENLSLLSDKRFDLSRVAQTIVGGDGASWIRRGARDNFINVLYILCRFHLNRAIKRALPKRKDCQKHIMDLLNQDSIDDALSYIKKLSDSLKETKEKEALKELYVYIRNNRQGINAIKGITDPDIRSKVMNTGTIESNIDKFLAHRFKKRGMSWSKKGALALLKIKQILANDEWEDWWNNQRDTPLEIHKNVFKTISRNETEKTKGKKDPLARISMPVLKGPHQDRPWVEMLRRLSAQQSSVEWRMV